MRSRRTAVGLAIALLMVVLAIAALFGARALHAVGNRAASELVIVTAHGTLRTTDDKGGQATTTEYAADGFTLTFPAWSPDGSRIAAIAHGTQGDGVFVFERPGTAPRRVYQDADHPPFYAYWTPDGHAIGFLTTEPDGLAVRLARADLSTPATIAHHGAPLYWAFTDSNRLLVHSGADQPAAFLGEVGVDGAVLASSPDTPGPFRAPAVSADGRYRAFEVNDAGVERVVVETRAGERVGAADAFGPAAVAFDPAGSHRLAILGADRPGFPTEIPIGPLRLIGPSFGTTRVLHQGLVIAFYWSPDGRTIATLAIDDGSPDTASLAAARGPTGSPETRSEASDFPVRLGFVDVSSGRHHDAGRVYLSDLFATQLFPYFDQYALSHHLWSPDGRSFLLPVVDDAGTSQITVFDPDGSPPRALAPGLIAFWSPR